MKSEGKIKIVEIIADSDLSGGPRHVLGLIRSLDPEKYSVNLICPSGYLVSEAKHIKGLHVEIVEMDSKFDLISIYKIFRKLQDIQVKTDPFGKMVVHVHGIRAGFLARIIKLYGVKYVYTEHRYDENYHLANRSYEWIQKIVLKYLNFKTDKVIAVSSSVQRFLMKNKLSRKSNTIIIPNGYDESTLDGSEKHAKKIKIKNEAPVIGNIGNLNHQKGHTYLFKAIKILMETYPLITLEIVGDGDLKEKLQKNIDDEGLTKNIALLGRKSNISNYLKNWDVFVLPSIAETFGISILEAMAAGVPVVASHVGGIVDIVKNNKNGLLVPPKDPKKLAEAIKKIIQDPIRSAEYKREAKETVERYKWANVIKEVEKVYEE